MPRRAVDKDINIYCLEPGCWNAHEGGPGRHRCEACKAKRREKMSQSWHDRQARRTRHCYGCQKRVLVTNFSKSEMARKKPRCNDCVNAEIVVAATFSSEHTYAKPSGYAISAPGW